MNLRVVSVLLLAGILAGCEQADPRIAMLREQDAARKELIGLLRAIKAEADLHRNKDVLAQKYAQVDQIARKAAGMLPPSADVVQAIQAEVPVWEQTITDLKAEVARVARLPGGTEVMQGIAGAR